MRKHGLFGLAAGLTAFACATSWQVPKDPVLRGGDNRQCDATGGCVDVALVLDTSESTGYPLENASAIVGLLETRMEANPGTPLRIEVDGVTKALDRLDKAKDAVAIVGFAGSPSIKNGGWVEAELTNNLSVAAEALNRIKARGGSGASCVSCGVKLGSSQLAPRQKTGRCAILVLVTDGIPTLPWGPAYADKNYASIAKELANTLAITRMVIIGAPSDREMLEHTAKAGGADIRFVADAEAVADAIADTMDRCG